MTKMLMLLQFVSPQLQSNQCNIFNKINISSSSERLLLLFNCPSPWSIENNASFVTCCIVCTMLDVDAVSLFFFIGVSSAGFVCPQYLYSKLFSAW